MVPDNKAAQGSVNIQDKRIPEITLLFAFPVIVPIPNKEPTETCVVETGNA